MVFGWLGMKSYFSSSLWGRWYDDPFRQKFHKGWGADLVSTYPLEDAKSHLSISVDCCERTRIL